MQRSLLLAAALVAALNASAGTGRVIIVNGNLPGTGFNDPTPSEPVGGNNGTTLGQQRLNVFSAAADRWSTMLDTDVDVIVQATFVPIAGCSATEAVLGQAGPTSWLHDFANAPRANVLYPIALANKFAGTDLSPGAADIFIQFNSSVDNPTCLGPSNWYYGFDGNEGIHSDLFVVVLHELAHGLGLAGAATAPGFSGGRPSIFDVHTLDLQAGVRWDQMSPEQRRVSLTNTGKVVWDGENVRAMLGRHLQPLTTLSVTRPEVVARNYEIGLASFGAQASRSFISGNIVGVLDAANVEGPTTGDGCTALTNAATLAGSVALVDRGTCTFVTKARNAQAAGAIGVVIVDNTRTCRTPPALGGSDAADVTIPVVSIAAADGDALRTQLAANATVSASLRNDPSQLAGTAGGQLRLYAPCTNEPGSSIHHWDKVASPNLLMEPAVNTDLLHGVDLTLYQLLDIGWTLPPRTGRPIGQR